MTDMDMLRPGDTIKCASKDDLIDTMCELQKEDIETDFLYELNNIKGYYLIITKIGA